MCGEQGSHYYVVICGPLASGKTSLTRIVSESLRWHPIYEDLGEHLYFADYYRDMRKWGFHTAIYFLIQALESQRTVKVLLDTGSVCQDWFVGEHQGVYNHHMLQQGILTSRDYRTCSQLDEVLSDYSVPPHLVVYLSASVNTLWSRATARQRTEEVEGLSPDYLEGLVNRYDNWLKTLELPLLKVDTDSYNYVDNDEYRAVVLEMILGSLG